MKEIKKPDLTAPRFRPEVYNVLNKEFFEKFKEKNPKYKDLDNVTLKKIIKTFNQLLYKTVVDTRDGIQLPESIGWLFIGTCNQSKKENIDFAKSHKYGVKVTNKNWDSDGKLAKIFFSNYAPKHKMKNREYWSFNACRDFKRLVAKSYPENWQMYIAADPKTKLEHAYSRLVYKDIVKRQTAKALETYNEFDL